MGVWERVCGVGTCSVEHGRELKSRRVSGRRELVNLADDESVAETRASKSAKV